MFFLRPRSSLALVFALVCAMIAVVPSPQPVLAASNVFVVNSASDPFPSDGKCDPIGTGDGCTLRDALTLTNADKTTGVLQIDFDIPQGNANPALNTVPGYSVTYPYGSAFPLETWTITLTQALPFLTRGNIDINGFSQEDNTPGTSNFTLGPVVVIDGKNLTSNTSGFTLSSDGNTLRGLSINNFSHGTPGIGIDIQGSNNTIQGNYIGIDKAALSPAPNTVGIRLIGRGISNNLIGGDNTQAAQRNIISGNNAEGIRIEFGIDGNNKIRGNYIGLNLSGVSDVGNKGDGIYIYASSANQIGALASDTVTNFANVISGNDRNGILIQDSSNNNIYGNLIGTNTNGAVAVANSGDGVKIESAAGSATNNSIGTPYSDQTKLKITRNVISGNGLAGVRITGTNTSDNTVFNDYIGPSSGGGQVTGVYSQTGVVVEQGAGRNQIGGGNPGQGNIIAGNKGDGVRIAGFQNGSTIINSNDNIVSGNTIGTLAIPNTGAGIVVDTYTNRTRIGGSSTNEGNRVVNNTGDGIIITGTKLISNTVLGNTIRSNGGNGVLVNGTNVMTTTLANNSINLNNGDGVQIAGANNTLVFSNTIGMGGGDASGNVGAGIRMTDSVSTTVQATKVIGNGMDGVWLSNVSAGRLTGNTVNQNNGNGFGVINGSTAISITNNTVYSNTLDGVLIGDSEVASQQVQITDNSISANGGLGINLEPGTQGVPGDKNNPNHDIDTPFGIHVNQDGLLTGRVVATANQPDACLGCLIQIFGTNPELHDGQGKTKIDAPVEISSNGYFTATIGSVPSQLALTATDRNGNTSEFGTFDATFGLAIGPPRSGTAAPGDVITYTHRITNTGSVDFTDLQLIATSSKGWPASVVPPAPISLVAGQSKPVTLTLTLPKAPNSTVLAGTVDLTRVTVRSSKIVTATASVTDTTTVASAFKLEVVPPSISGIVAPGSVLTYTHTLRNVGNLTGTLVLSASTTPSWTTTITPTTVTLGPGQERPVNVGVFGPKGATAGTRAKTTIGIQISSPLGQAPVYVTDTTTIALQPDVTIIPNNDKRASPGQMITVEHIVTNNSNGPIKLRLASSSPRNGSDPRTSYVITFRSATPGVTLGSDNSFTLGTDESNQQLQLLVDIRVPDNAPLGAIDDIYISLYQDTGTLVGSVTDTVRVIAAPLLPQAYLPFVQQYYDLSNTPPTP